MWKTEQGGGGDSAVHVEAEKRTVTLAAVVVLRERESRHRTAKILKDLLTMNRSQAQLRSLISSRPHDVENYTRTLGDNLAGICMGFFVVVQGFTKIL